MTDTEGTWNWPPATDEQGQPVGSADDVPELGYRGRSFKTDEDRESHTVAAEGRRNAEREAEQAHANRGNE
jgi:hypothetical protein